jgi:hypothetical protein
MNAAAFRSPGLAIVIEVCARDAPRLYEATKVRVPRGYAEARRAGARGRRDLSGPSCGVRVTPALAGILGDQIADNQTNTGGALGCRPLRRRGEYR